MLILVVDGITTIIVWKHVRLSTILKVIVTEMMDVDGMPRQEVESVPRIARIRTVTRRVVNRIRSVVRGSMTRQHVLRVAVCRTMIKRIAMLILVVDGIPTTYSVLTTIVVLTILKVIVTEMMNVFGSTARMSVFRIVLLRMTMRHPVTLRLDVDGMPREVECVPRIARIRTVTRRVVRRIRSVVRGSMTRQHKLMTLEETLTSTTVTDLHGWSRMFGQELAAALVAVAVTVHSQ